MTKKELQLSVVFAGLEIDQTVLAERTEEDRTAINRVLSGKRKSPKVIKKIVAVVANDLEALLTEPDAQTLTVK